MSVTAFAADPQYVKPLVGGGGGYLCLDELGMHKLKGDNSRGGSPRGGQNFISSLPRTSVVAVRVVGGGDVRVVGNKDVVEDVDGD